MGVIVVAWEYCMCVVVVLQGLGVHVVVISWSLGARSSPRRGAARALPRSKVPARLRDAPPTAARGVV